MQALLDEFVLVSPLAPVLSLDSLYAARDDDPNPFDIPDRTTLPPDEMIDAFRARSAIHSFLGTLSPRQRDIAERVFWRGESQASIARSYGVSGAAISKNIDKILKLGRTYLASHKDTRAIPVVA